MPPIIYHGVPDDELYVGEDGIQRPYAMVFPGTEGTRSRRVVPETGAFGKSTRRSRSKTGTPGKRENPTQLAGEALLAEYLAEFSSRQPESPQRQNPLPSSASQSNFAQSTALNAIDGNATNTRSNVHKIPTEVILRGFKSSHQYAALNRYENIGGCICEDYPRDPPVEQRRYKSDLRDPAVLRTRKLTPEEKAKARRFAGGENWIKVTFESAEAAEAAIYASPQTILGYLVYAEPYQGLPPTITDAIPADGATTRSKRTAHSQPLGPSSSVFSPPRDRRQASSTLPRSISTPEMSMNRSHLSVSPTHSSSSSNTLDTATLSTATAGSTTSSQTITEDPTSLYCRRIPTARKVQLLPATEALLPQESYTQRVVKTIPLINWLSSDIIGNVVPRTETGEFDWANASFYWKIVWWLDNYFGIYGGDVAGGRDD